MPGSGVLSANMFSPGCRPVGYPLKSGTGLVLFSGLDPYRTIVTLPRQTAKLGKGLHKRTVPGL